MHTPFLDSLLIECAGLVHARRIPVKGVKSLLSQKALDTSIPNTQAISDAQQDSYQVHRHAHQYHSLHPPSTAFSEGKTSQFSLKMLASWDFFSCHYTLGNKANALKYFHST